MKTRNFQLHCKTSHLEKKNKKKKTILIQDKDADELQISQSPTNTSFVEICAMFPLQIYFRPTGKRWKRQFKCTKSVHLLSSPTCAVVWLQRIWATFGNIVFSPRDVGKAQRGRPTDRRQHANDHFQMNRASRYGQKSYFTMWILSDQEVGHFVNTSLNNAFNKISNYLITNFYFDNCGD